MPLFSSSSCTELTIEKYQTYINSILLIPLSHISHYHQIFKHCAHQHQHNLAVHKLYSLFELVCSYAFVPSNPNTPFQTQCLFRSADPTELEEEKQDFLQDILPKIDNKIIQARVADVLSVFYPRNQSQNVEIALKAYIEVFQTQITEHEGFRILERILTLADEKRVDQVFQILQRFVREHGVQEIRLLGYMIDLFLKKAGGSKKKVKKFAFLIQAYKDQEDVPCTYDKWRILKSYYVEMKELTEIEICQQLQEKIYNQWSEDAQEKREA